MKPTEQKEQFIIKRAEGLSYSKIAEDLQISKSTCCKWEQELQSQIKAAREDRLQELYSLYRLGRESHIEKLGAALERIDTALAAKDLTEVPADKLLKLKLEYESKLQELYTADAESSFTEYSTEEILREAASIYDRLKAGQITAVQAKSELAAIEGVQRAANANEAAAFNVF